MKATGIVRRIDDLGRIVIPKEIRRNFKIREGDQLEIFTEREGSIVLRKYSPMGDLGELAKQYAACLAAITELGVLITDRDQITAVAGLERSKYESHGISRQLEEAQKDRANVSSGNGGISVPILDGQDGEEFPLQVVFHIICEGDVAGSVIIVSKNEINDVNDENEKKGSRVAFFAVAERSARAACDFLSRQMEM